MLALRLSYLVIPLGFFDFLSRVYFFFFGTFPFFVARAVHKICLYCATARVTQRVKSDLPSASQKCSSDNDDGESRSVTRLEAASAPTAATATTPVAVKQESMEPLVGNAGGGNSTNNTTSSTSLHATNNSSSLVVSGGFVDSTTFTSRQQLMPQQPPPAPPPQQQSEQEESVVPSKDHTHSLVFLFLPPPLLYYSPRRAFIYMLSEGE
jgi:hypothetical protein